MCQPGRPRALGLPEQAVQRVALARPLRVAAAFPEDLLAQALLEPRDGAEVRVRVHVEVNILIDVVGGAHVEQPPHQRHDQRDRLDRADVAVGRQNPQRGHVLAEQRGLAHREHLPVVLVARGPLEQRIVDVRHVLHVAHVVSGVQPGALHEVEGEVGGGVAEVGRVVRGDSAGVDPGRTVGGGSGRGGDQRVGRGVVQPRRDPETGQFRQVGGRPGFHSHHPNGSAGATGSRAVRSGLDLQAGTRPEPRATPRHACRRRAGQTSGIFSG
jgi:hypothetical protein